ncbi:hypothetical protein P8452_07531 [Trifolium repens]|nr:hypothetical protein P8452_07531 [Trifolium repens]
MSGMAFNFFKNKMLFFRWPGVQMRRNSWQDGVLGTNCPIPSKCNWTYQFQVKDQIGSFFYFPSTNFQRASGGFGPKSIRQNTFYLIKNVCGRPGVQMRRNSWQDGVLGTNCPIPSKCNWTYQFQVKDQIGSFFYFPSTNFQRASGGFGPKSIRQNTFC